MKAEHLYVHVPFCARRCVYCDFSIAVRSRVPVEEYAAALDRELELRHGESGFELETLYFGGGTPSKLGEAGVARVMDAVRRRAGLRPGAEVTLEANPEDVTPAAARAWRAAGVTRVSLGVQSFQDAVLAWMHRTHDAASALRSVHVLREEGLSNLSIDLIFAMPESVPRSWEQDLEMAAALDLPHLSVYGLTVEPHTPLGRWVARKDVAESPEERFEREFLRAHETLTAGGHQHYEVSNYGRPGFHSRHNWAYWKRHTYGGVGPSAHEFDGQQRRWNAAPYADWLARLRAGEDPEAGREQLSPDQESAERIYLDLRTTTGAQLSPSEAAHVGSWLTAGWATLDADLTLRLTASGWLRLDALASDLTTLRSRY